MKHLKKFESIRNPVQRNIEGPYKEMLNDFLQDIRDEEFEVIISPFANKFEIINYSSNINLQECPTINKIIFFII